MFRNLIFSLAFLTISLIGASFDDGANAFYKRDYKTAFSIFEDFAKQGDISAQYNLGLMYYNGFGVKQDYLIAKDWYEKAAIKRHAWAQYNFGVMYYNGFGVKKRL